MFGFVLTGFMTFLLSLAALLAPSGILGYLAGAMTGATQPQANCYLNGAAVDCGTLPELSQ